MAKRSVEQAAVKVTCKLENIMSKMWMDVTKVCRTCLKECAEPMKSIYTAIGMNGIDTTNLNGVDGIVENGEEENRHTNIELTALDLISSCSSVAVSQFYSYSLLYHYIISIISLLTFGSLNSRLIYLDCRLKSVRNASKIYGPRMRLNRSAKRHLSKSNRFCTLMKNLR